MSACGRQRFHRKIPSANDPPENARACGMITGRETRILCEKIQFGEAPRWVADAAAPECVLLASSGLRAQ